MRQVKMLRALHAQQVFPATRIRLASLWRHQQTPPRHQTDQNRWMMPTPAANWLRDEDGAPF
jgi:hypothetical protein